MLYTVLAPRQLFEVRNWDMVHCTDQWRRLRKCSNRVGFNPNGDAFAVVSALHGLGGT